MKYNLKQKKASILIYIIILVNVALIMALVVASNTFLLESNYNLNNTNKALLSWIISKSNLSVKYTNFLNSNGSWAVDNIGCPWAVTMSWVVNYSSSSASLAYSWGIFCQWSHNTKEFKIYFNSWFTDFEQAHYDGSIITLAGKTGTFFDTDNTYMDFSSYTNTPDNIDDDFDSDNFKVNSTGSYFYPNNYSDDDVLARKTLYGYISPNTWFKNIFWSNSQIKDYINSNTNNTDFINSKLWDTSAKLILDVDRDFKMKVVRFDKDQFEWTSELITLEVEDSISASWWVGYIQDNLTLAWNITWSEYNFDLINDDYAVFLENTGTGVLFFRVTWEDTVGKGIYINPIDDTNPSIIKTLWYEILNVDGKYISKILEIVWEKTWLGVDEGGGAPTWCTYGVWVYGICVY